jgi:hypothetical protein
MTGAHEVRVPIEDGSCKERNVTTLTDLAASESASYCCPGLHTPYEVEARCRARPCSEKCSVKMDRNAAISSAASSVVPYRKSVSRKAQQAGLDTTHDGLAILGV